MAASAPHARLHMRQDVVDRPTYREGRRDRAVKAYSISRESKYLLVQDVPALGATKELLELFALYGDIEEYRLLDEYPSEPFTDVYWIKFKDIRAARVAKRKLDDYSFLGQLLHVTYAPEFESLDDARDKLLDRRRAVSAKLGALSRDSGGDGNGSRGRASGGNPSAIDGVAAVADYATAPATAHAMGTGSQGSRSRHSQPPPPNQPPTLARHVTHAPPPPPPPPWPPQHAPQGMLPRHYEAAPPIGATPTPAPTSAMPHNLRLPTTALIYYPYHTPRHTGHTTQPQWRPPVVPVPRVNTAPPVPPAPAPSAAGMGREADDREVKRRRI